MEFGLWKTVCKPFADGTAQVQNPIHTYVHLVCEPFANGSHVCVYRLLETFSDCNQCFKKGGQT